MSEKEEHACFQSELPQRMRNAILPVLQFLHHQTMNHQPSALHLTPLVPTLNATSCACNSRPHIQLQQNSARCSSAHEITHLVFQTRILLSRHGAAVRTSSTFTRSPH